MIGLAFVNKFRNKNGYRLYEHSTYVDPNHLQKEWIKNISELIQISKKNKNIKNLIAVIGGSENIASVTYS